MAIIRISEPEFSEMKKLIVDDTIKGCWKEQCIKKYLLDLYIFCSKTHDDDYMEFYKRIDEYFGTTFPKDLADVVQEWINSSLGLMFYVRDVIGDTHPDDLDLAKKYQRMIREKIEEIKFNENIIKVYSSRQPGVDYSDEEIISKIRTAEDNLAVGLRLSLRKSISECDMRVKNSMIYGSAKELLEGFGAYAISFADAFSPAKDFERYIENKRKEALTIKSDWQSNLNAKKPQFRKKK